MTRALVVWIPGAVKSPMNGAHGHWTAKAAQRKDQREKAQLVVSTACREQDWLAASDAPKLVTFVASVHNLMDDDNLRAALKSTRDGLKDAGIIHDDGPKSGHRFEYHQEIDRRKPGVMVRVEIMGGKA